MLQQQHHHQQQQQKQQQHQPQEDQQKRKIDPEEGPSAKRFCLQGKHKGNTIL
jgi:hypothetical protein